MVEAIQNYVSFWSVTLGLLLYWVPVVICFIGYLHLTILDFNKEIIKRDEARMGRSYFTPTLTVGVVLGRGILVIIPVVNLFLVVFKFVPYYASGFVSRLGKIFSSPFVSWTEEDQAARIAAQEQIHRTITSK